MPSFAGVIPFLSLHQDFLQARFATGLFFIIFNLACVVKAHRGNGGLFYFNKINFKNYLELSLAIVYFCDMATKNTRIDANVLERVNDHVKMSGQPASVFIGIGVTLLLDTVQGQKASKTKYFSEMGEYLMKEINKKKK